MNMNLAVFASGRGSNAQAIYDYFKKESAEIRFALLVSNYCKADVVRRAKDHWGVRTFICPETLRDDNCDTLLEVLRSANIGFIALAGFLKRIPPCVIAPYQGRILNLHPSLLPKYGGKGMYGMRVHKAVRDANERFSGISIHEVNEAYDKGRILRQEKCDISSLHTTKEIAEAVTELEHKHYPQVIAKHAKNYRLEV